VDSATLVVLCGLPGAGKSKYAFELQRDQFPNALILSSDAIRWTFGTEFDPRCEQFVWGALENLALGCLHHGRDVIIDATNLTRERRLEYVWWSQESSTRIECHYLPVSLTESARRCTKWIAAERIRALVVEEPQQSEGFNALVVIDANWHARRKKRR